MALMTSIDFYQTAHSHINMTWKGSDQATSMMPHCLISHDVARLPFALNTNHEGSQLK